VVLALVVALVAVSSIVIMLVGRGFQHQRTITVTAVGTASANPSMAELDILLNATGNTVYLANANLSAIANELNATLLPFLNGNASRIQTVYYSVYQPTNCTYVSPAYYCKESKLPYYAATESIEALMPNIANVSDAITAVSGIPDLQIQDVQAQLSEGQQAVLSREALSQAVENATSQAEIVAGSGTSISIENITVQYSQVYCSGCMFGASSGAVAQGASPSAFFGGRASVQKNVYVVFSMR
jgi:uncharacterized protein YggE